MFGYELVMRVVSVNGYLLFVEKSDGYVSKFFAANEALFLENKQKKKRYKDSL